MIISVIVPIYNVEEYIRDCLDSILNQTYDEFEVILVDDGSTDSSYEIAAEYALRDNRIKVIRQNNGGVSSARNKGLNEVSGEYLTFVDADDYIAVNYLESLVRPLQYFECDIVFSGMIDFDKSGIKNSITLNQRSWRFESSEDCVSFFKQELNTSPVAKLYKLSLIREYGLCFDTGLSLGEDFKFNLEYFKYIKSAYSISYSGYYYRRDVYNSLTHRICRMSLHDRIDIWSILYENFCIRNLLCDTAKEFIANEIYNIVNDYIVGVASEMSVNESYKVIKREFADVNIEFLIKNRQFVHASLIRKELIINKYIFLMICICKFYKVYGKARRLY